MPVVVCELYTIALCQDEICHFSTSWIKLTMDVKWFCR